MRGAVWKGAGEETEVATLTVSKFDDAGGRQGRRDAGIPDPTLGRDYLRCAYAPMVELLDYPHANGFANYIVSGGGRDLMHPITQEVYGIPREWVIGSSSTFAYTSNERAEPSPTSRRPTTSTTAGEAGADLEPDRPTTDSPRRPLDHLGSAPHTGMSLPSLPMISGTSEGQRRQRTDPHPRRRRSPGPGDDSAASRQDGGLVHTGRTGSGAGK
jgi:hypothetical protein